MLIQLKRILWLLNNQGKYEIFTFGKAKTKTKSNAKLRKPEEKQDL